VKCLLTTGSCWQVSEPDSPGQHVDDAAAASGPHVREDQPDRADRRSQLQIEVVSQAIPLLLTGSRLSEPNGEAVPAAPFRQVGWRFRI
jgi:hypothetical protein